MTTRRSRIPFFDTFYFVYTFTILAAFFLIGALDGSLVGTLLALYQLPMAYFAFHNDPMVLLLRSGPTPDPGPDDSNSYFDQRG